MKKFYLSIALTAVTFTAVNTVSAATVTKNDSLPYLNTGTMASWDTVGNDMIGMTVTAYFTNSTIPLTSVWTKDQGALGIGWSLTLDDYNKSTYTDTTKVGALWSLEVLDESLILDKIVIDGAPGNTVFDYINWPETTPGSAFGWKLDWSRYSGQATNTNFTATYSTPVKLNSLSNPLFDVYSTLTIDFDAGAGFGINDVLKFYADTDNTIAPVPEPMTLLLFGTGLVGLLGSRIRRKK